MLEVAKLEDGMFAYPVVDVIKRFWRKSRSPQN